MADLPKIGIDIGSASIKLVELAPERKGMWKLVTAASMTTPPGFSVESGASGSGMSQVISKLVKESGARSRRVIVALPEEQASSHIIEMPIMKDEELKKALQWQVEQYIPIPSEKAVWSSQVIGKHESSGTMEVLLVAAAKNLVNGYVQIMEQAGLEVEVLETELVAEARSLASEKLPFVLIVDIGAKSSDLGVVNRGQLVFARTIPTSGASFNRAIETGLGLDALQADEYKNSYGFAANQLGGKVAAAMKPVLDVVANEIKKTVDFYVSKHPGEVVNAVILSGGVASVPEIVTMLSAILGVEVVVGNPFVNVNMNDKQRTLLAGAGPFYSVAVGLAMREL